MPPSTGLTRLAEAASAATSRSSSTSATGHSRLLDDDDSTDELLGIDHHGAPEVEEVAPPAPVAKHAVATATLKDVVLLSIHFLWKLPSIHLPSKIPHNGAF